MATRELNLIGITAITSRHAGKRYVALEALLITFKIYDFICNYICIAVKYTTINIRHPQHGPPNHP